MEQRPSAPHHRPNISTGGRGGGASISARSQQHRQGRPHALIVMPRWSLQDMPTLTGRRALVTGATQGIGFQLSIALACAGAEVLIAGRTRASVDAAVAAIVCTHP